MLITLGKISDGDFGEQSLTSRFLLSLILNEYSAVNTHGQAFCKFGERCLGLEHLRPEDMNIATATVEFKADKCIFDALFTLEPEWLWGIEAKYFDYLEIEQINKELRAIEKLKKKLMYQKAGLLFILPEQLLGSIVKYDEAVRQRFFEIFQSESSHLRLTSWEIIFKILIEASSGKIEKELQKYCDERNRNKKYPLKLSIRPAVHGYLEWGKIIIHPKDLPQEISELPKVIYDSFKKIGGESSTISELFCDSHLALATQIIEKSGFESKCRTRYINLSKSKRAHAQLHPHSDGIDLAIREVDESLPKCKILRSVLIDKLYGYWGTNINWLKGNDKNYTKKPAAAFHIPKVLESNLLHPGWEEVKILLDYAHTR